MRSQRTLRWNLYCFYIRYQTFAGSTINRVERRRVAARLPRVRTQERAKIFH